MSRTLELGRAVLGSSEPHLELWLTTFITLLTPQSNSDLQQLSATSLFNLLSSGRMWADRGHDLHLVIEPTFGEEPLAAEHLQQLTESLFHAPLWTQLMLEPCRAHTAVTTPGTIRLGLGQASFEEADVGQKRRRLPLQVPAGDVRPPEHIATVTLQAVRLCMNILEPRQSTRPALRRSRVPLSKDSVAHPKIELDPEYHGSATTIELSGGEYSPSDPVVQNEGQKRRRLTKGYDLHGAAQHHRAPLTNNGNGLLSCRPEDQIGLQDPQANCNAARIEGLIESAIRIAISGSLGRLTNGSKVKVKVKANTIRRSLSDIAPCVWKPGFLQALSQRAHLLPTLRRSLMKMVLSQDTSLSSLPVVLSRLTATMYTEAREVKDYVNTLRNGREDEGSSALADQVWIHLQRTLSTRPATSVLPGLRSVIRSNSPGFDDMLADVNELATSYVLYDRGEGIMADGSLLLLDNSPLLAVDLAPAPHVLGQLYSEAVPEQAYALGDTDDGLLYTQCHTVTQS
ncbi:hypothetical protein T440DRAFT_470623 [Plenodomus tracheiphilus IPT5]|uniref:Uncharacterized protein n=1 Tax=Plenodomus tracheiphilus IPT5 TaxID=1408161 RepID=A0A6A7B0V0_9PLEO|nr:hypothetical protein T440DRAFT_470623 [Plenodomus tracheiphilus IPT5]